LLGLFLDNYEEKFILRYWENSKEPKLLWFYIRVLAQIENYRDSFIYYQVYKWFKRIYLKTELMVDELQFGVTIESKKNEEDSDEEELEDDIKEKLNHYKRLFTGFFFFLLKKFVFFKMKYILQQHNLKIFFLFFCRHSII
jgi:hypothetical protein